MEENITFKEEVLKVVENYPKYDGNPINYKGSQEYWLSIFSHETNRDPKLHEDFSKLHENIVNMVIDFCKEHNLTDIDGFTVSADGLASSIKFGGKWGAGTDSSMSIYKEGKNANHAWTIPFLFQI